MKTGGGRRGGGKRNVKGGGWYARFGRLCAAMEFAINRRRKARRLMTPTTLVEGGLHRGLSLDITRRGAWRLRSVCDHALFVGKNRASRVSVRHVVRQRDRQHAGRVRPGLRRRTRAAR